jgi:hypothetical protein
MPRGCVPRGTASLRISCILFIRICDVKQNLYACQPKMKMFRCPKPHLTGLRKKSFHTGTKLSPSCAHFVFV